ncbi:MAG: hypothetical protein HY744_27960 [Deltaproteobacteria bacterium]|nr:hypothetical protein [Deltaproteobacteria bacterium]
MALPPDFRDLFWALAASGADAIVVGGWAVGFHTEPRFTKDLDLPVGQDPENLHRVARALRTFGAPATVVEALRGLGPDEFLFLVPCASHLALYSRQAGIEEAMTSLSAPLFPLSGN